jgi:hypothetical protein
MTVAGRTDFWQGFAEDHWDRIPGRLDGTAFRDLLNADLFSALTTYASHWRTGQVERPTDVRMFLNGSTVNGNRLGAKLPMPEDGGFDGYIRRITAEESGADWNLVANSVQRYSYKLFDAARRVLDSVFSAAGRAPTGMTDCHMIVGAYQEAPTRVHKDTAHVFSLVLSGSKSYYTWPFDYFLPVVGGVDARHEQVNLDVDFRDHLHAAQLLTAGAGEVLYWPATTWHVAVSDGEPHVSLHIASYTDASAVRMARSVVDGMLDEAQASSWLADVPYPFTGPLEGAADVDAALATIDTVRRGLPERLRRRELARRTAVNFEFVPPPGPVTPVAPGTAVATHDRAPILIDIGASGTALLAANGHVVQVPQRPWLPALVRTLNEARPEHPVTVEQLELADRDAADARRLLSALTAYRAVAVVPAAT